MQFNRNKLRCVVHHTISKCRADKLGAVKLHKVLYYSDMLRYAETGNSLTGSHYRKRPFGPTCEELSTTLNQMVADGIVETKSVNYFGYLKKQFSSQTQPDLSCLSTDETALINEVIDFVCEQNSAKSISEYSHSRAWDSVDFGEEIRYNSVFLIFPDEVSQEALDWASGQVGEVEAQKSSHPSVDPLDFAAFRSKILEARGTS